MPESDPPPQPVGQDPRDERQLLTDIGRGDRAAADELVERTYEMIYGALHRLTGGDAELAADLTQESYRRAWGSLAGFQGRSRFSTLMLTGTSMDIEAVALVADSLRGGF